MLKNVIVVFSLCILSGYALTISNLANDVISGIAANKMGSISFVEEVDENSGMQSRASCILKPACYQNKRYYFEPSVKRTRSDAASYCNMIGMNLVSIETCGENAFIIDFIKDIGCAKENFWTSGYLNSDNTWIWDGTGKPFTFTNWKVSEPNNKSKDEYCVHYRYDYLQWNDETCSKKYLYICESNDAC